MRAIRVQRTNYFPVFRHTRDRLLVHFLDHVPFTQFTGGIVHVGNHHPADAGRQIQLTRQVRGQFLHLHSGQRRFILQIIFVRTRCGGRALRRCLW